MIFVEQVSFFSWRLYSWLIDCSYGVVIEEELQKLNVRLVILLMSCDRCSRVLSLGLLVLEDLSGG